MRAVDNPAHRFQRAYVEWAGQPPAAQLRVYEQRAGQILSRNESADLPYRYGVNPYRGCYHACAYCYARPSHAYLDFGVGTDFERKIVVKVNAAEQLRAAFQRPGWRGERICLSGNTDCYQPLEAAYGITRACIETCLAYRNPLLVITKGALIERDVDLLAALSRVTQVRVYLSIGYVDDGVGRALEPDASPVSRRFRALQRLSAAGIDTGVAVSPMIAGLNDHTIPAVLARAAAAGAQEAFMTPLRLDPEVRPLFLRRLRRALPDAAGRIEAAIAEVRGGQLDERRIGHRMRGTGHRYRLIQELFSLHARRLGLSTNRELAPAPDTFVRPRRQLALFE